MKRVRRLGRPGRPTLRHALLALLVACNEKRAKGEPCKDAGDCDTGERCYQEVNEAGQPLGAPLCATCEEEGGQAAGVETCLQLQVDTAAGRDSL